MENRTNRAVANFQPVEQPNYLRVIPIKEREDDDDPLYTLECEWEDFMGDRKTRTVGEVRAERDWHITLFLGKGAKAKRQTTVHENLEQGLAAIARERGCVLQVVEW